MIMRFENVRAGGEGIWMTDIEPSDLGRFGKPVSQVGEVSVLVVCGPKYNGDAQSLEFDFNSSTLLNLGDTASVVVLDVEKALKLYEQRAGDKVSKNQIGGDNLFLSDLKRVNQDIYMVGKTILENVRGNYDGVLDHKVKSGKFVESPDNFWVVKVQPRVRNLRFVVYGSPEIHKRYKNIELKKDMGSYSSFIVDSKEQVNDAVDAIISAKKLKRR